MNQLSKIFIVSKKTLSCAKRGFTLIELLIVMGVIGVLAGTVVVLINPRAQIQKSHDSQRKSDLKQIQQALEQYYSDKGYYPADGTFTFGSAWTSYMPKVPTDPSTGRNYYYTRVDTNTYRMYVSLELNADPQATSCVAGTTCSNRPTGNECGSAATAPCNYGVSSSNTTP